ncbi:hypothetical protein V1279_003099 [Bradyrhizobium sp. AZCC 1610]|uniref:DUF7831 domain-containing protein n=1 Tax=Bradyrhizobium sp. AZCC 1610 TaxID=3117020 RepID=UPI002FF2106B
MPVIFQQWITRQDLRDNPRNIYVFGDNVQRIGLGGQAKEMRGEPNAIGVATKWAPSMHPRAFFDDTVTCRNIVRSDLRIVQQALDLGRTVVVPTDGVGTGLARLDLYAPNLDRFIKDWFKARTRASKPHPDFDRDWRHSA